MLFRSTVREIIDRIIAKRFHFDLKELHSRERELTFMRCNSDLASSLTLRNSCKFLHPHYDLIDAFFAKVPCERLKRHFATSAKLGATLDITEVEEEGFALYVSPAAIRREDTIDLDKCVRLKKSAYLTLKHRFGLAKSDILIARSGEGTIGKVSVFGLDEPAIFSDFTMRLRLRGSLLPAFAFYYFRSTLFQAQIEREKRGMGNMTNIFPSQVERLLVPDCDLGRQKAIAKEIEIAISEFENASQEALIEQKRIGEAVDKMLASVLGV